MKFLVDEDVSGVLVDELNARGNDAVWVKRVCPGAPDGDLVHLARREERTIVTGDKGYGERVFVHGQVVAVILLRLSDLPSDQLVPHATTVIMSRDDWHQFVSTITTRGVRRRRLPAH